MNERLSAKASSQHYKAIYTMQLHFEKWYKAVSKATQQLKGMIRDDMHIIRICIVTISYKDYKKIIFLNFSQVGVKD